MKIIDRYVSSQVLTTSLFAVGILSFVLVLGNVFTKLLNVLVNHDAPWELVISVIAYIIPFSLTFTIPWGFLTSVLLVFGKMSAENELIALRSSGVSVPRTAVLVFVMSVLCVFICLWINLDVAPRAQQQMKDAFFRLATSNPLSMFGSDRVIDEFPGRKIYVEDNKGSQLKNLLVYEMNDDNVPIRVVFAREGTLETDNEHLQILLHLKDARYEQRDDKDPMDLMKIKDGILMQETTLPVSLQELYDKNRKRRGPGQMPLDEIIDAIKSKKFADSAAGISDSANKAEKTPDEIKKEEQQAREYHTNVLTEINKRLSISLASFAFGLIGVPLAITAHRKETSVGFLLSMVVAFVYFCFILVADTLRSHPGAHPEWLVWSPNVIFITLGSVLFYRLSRR